MNPDALIQDVRKCKILQQDVVRTLCRRVKALFFQESNVQTVQAPVTVCGDVHGQFWDVLEMFARGGDVATERYVLLGDYVDRGYNSVETILLLFLYKLKYPDRIVLLRGNHQSRNVTYMYGFYEQIGKKYGNHNVWYYFNDAFDFLPIAAIIQGEIFCVHGGLSPKKTSIDYIRSIQRNMEIPSSGPLCDLMWSDPQEGLQGWKQNSRGAGWLFGEKAVEEFLLINEIKLILRSHQLVQEGYKKYFEGKDGNPKLYTVWSAPNYCYRMNNLASILKIDINLEQKFIVYKASDKNAQNKEYKMLLPYFL